MKKLSPRQLALLERVCLKKYTVRYSGYAGNFRPNASVSVQLADGPLDHSFLPHTLYSLEERKLVQRIPGGSHIDFKIVPTPAGLDAWGNR